MTEKPHALKPLSILVEYFGPNDEVYSHPYLFEIDNLKFTDRQLAKRPTGEPKATPDMNLTPLLYVDTKSKLRQAIDEIVGHSCPEVAMDVEAHTYRSYQGFTCLIQMSTREKDYIIDPFPLWQDLTMLNEITANPKIVKLLHGGFHDVVWLQRDFSLYFVNLFDSYLAVKLLDFPRGCLSLAYLLSSIAKVTTDKKFQLADWRMRPLPEEMAKYARMDTHYLIDIYHELKDQLLDRSNENLNLIKAAYDQANDLCRRRYEKPVFRENINYKDFLIKSKVNFNSRQTLAFKEIFAWRDATARVEDESVAYVIPGHMMLKICIELPREMQGILACCNPVPPLVKQNLHALHEIILKARDSPLTVIHHHDDNAVSSAVNKANPTDQALGLDSIVDNPLRCPLDLVHLSVDNADNSTDFPKLDVLLDTPEAVSEVLVVLSKNDASIKAFAKKQDDNVKFVSKNNKCFLTPYERYKLLNPYLNSIKDNKKDEASTTKKASADSDADRIKSIKEHFDTLTKMTPQQFTQESTAVNIDNDNDNEEEEEEPETLTIDDFDPNPGKVPKKLRMYDRECNASKEAKKRAKIREKEEKLENKRRKTVVDNVKDTNFDQYSSGVAANAKHFDPMREFKDKHAKRKPFAGGKAKQRYKGGANKSITYKK